MGRKSEIKVYLPERLVGELEGRRRMGTRSKFIENAINRYLRKIDGVTPSEFNQVHLLCTVRDNFAMEGLTTYSKIIQAIIDEVNR